MVFQPAIIYTETKEVLQQFLQQVPLTEKQVLVLGVSTSEVTGKRIGTAGTAETAASIFRAVKEASEANGFQLAFQCCEHLNRALVVERNTADQYQLEEVSVVPVPQAGGAMAAYAFQHMQEPVIVDQIQADAGIDIGDTLIGMHLKRVAVPVRIERKHIGQASVTLAKTRPKLIGGERAVYVWPASSAETC